jgi:hypothetical protein
VLCATSRSVSAQRFGESRHLSIDTAMSRVAFLNGIILGNRYGGRSAVAPIVNTTLARNGIAGCGEPCFVTNETRSVIGIGYRVVYGCDAQLRRVRVARRISDSSGAKGDDVENSRESLLRRHAGCM